MKIERTQNAARNIVFDGMLKFFNIAIPFFMRSIILYTLGVEFLGLGGLFRSLLSFLNLAELGVGSAMVYSMYKPIAEDDTESICALMKLYRTVYRFIGLFIAVAGLALTPFLRGLIKGDTPPNINLYILYFMNLGNTVLTYWLFAYKNCLLFAHQRHDVSSKVGLVIHFIEYGLKMVVLLLFRNYYIYLAIQLVSQAAINIFTAIKVDQMYPNYSARGIMPKDQMLDVFRRVRDLFTAKLSYVIFNSADTLVVSSFMGLTVLAVYQNYYYIVTSLKTMIDVILKACTAGVGNSLLTESGDKNYRDMKKISLLFSWMLGVTTTMLLCMYQPFMEIWMGKENMLSFGYAVCFSVYYYSLGCERLVNMFKDAAGIWRKDRWRPLAGVLVNLGLNLATVQWLGLYGVLLSSVVSIAFVQMPWLFHNLFQVVYPHKYLKDYTVNSCVYILLSSVSCAASWFLCSRFSLKPWPALILNACISFVVPNIIFFLVYGRTPMFKQSVIQIKRIVLRKKSKAHS